MRSEVKYDISKLNVFAKSITENYQVRVGIFGNKNARGEAANKPVGKSGHRSVAKGSVATSTNAEIGFLHEFGSILRGIPQRSFLRMPLAVKGNQIIKEASVGAQKLLAEGKVAMVMRRLGIACENAIQRAFASRGYGHWKENAPATVRRKGSDAPLIDTAQLRRSISSKVVKI